MANFKQGDRPVRITTPLGEDVLLALNFGGHEGISKLFHFRIDLFAENQQTVILDKLLGEKITLTVVLPEKKERYFNGICIRASQGGRDREFTEYSVEIVPKFWRLTRKVRSRIFQQKSVPDILKEVLAGFDVTYDIRGTFEPWIIAFSTASRISISPAA